MVEKEVEIVPGRILVGIDCDIQGNLVINKEHYLSAARFGLNLARAYLKSLETIYKNANPLAKSLINEKLEDARFQLAAHELEVALLEGDTKRVEGLMVSDLLKGGK